MNITEKERERETHMTCLVMAVAGLVTTILMIPERTMTNRAGSA